MRLPAKLIIRQQARHSKSCSRAYLKSLAALSPDPAYAGRHEQKMKEMVTALYKNDVAINLGKKIFKDQFKKFWMDSFWNVQIPVSE